MSGNLDLTVDNAGKFESVNPATGEVVGSHPVHEAIDVEAAVTRARGAAQVWAEMGFSQRRKRLKDWRTRLANNAEELAELVRAETGKPLHDARLETLLAIDHLNWAAKNASKVLGRQRVSSGLLMSNHWATLEYLPLGVVGVIGPWNYPVFTPMGSIAYALAAGNAVVFKPSEYTPGVGEWLARNASESIKVPGIFEVVTGFGSTGAALVNAGVDKIAFTGSAKTGKKIAVAAADTLTPVLMECGGKDALLVDADADLDAAADAAVWGGMSNAGQTCVGVERVYVHAGVYDSFVEKVVERASKVEAGYKNQPDIGPITMPSQLEVIKSHIADALAQGGQAVVGGMNATDDRYARPTVLLDVPEDSIAVTEETFGPTLTVKKVRDMDEAVRLANDSRYGLGSTVFSRKSGADLARRLRSGMTAVNSVISFAGIPSLPFGGVGESGYGRIHGADGLREFTRPKAIARQIAKVPVSFTTFDRSEMSDKVLPKMIKRRYGGGGD